MNSDRIVNERMWKNLTPSDQPVDLKNGGMRTGRRLSKSRELRVNSTCPISKMKKTKIKIAGGIYKMNHEKAPKTAFKAQVERCRRKVRPKSG